MAPFILHFCIPFLLLLLVVPAAHGADVPPLHAHVRTSERLIAQLLRRALVGSPAFRDLVERLNASDVVVYVRSSRELPTYVEGRLAFIGAAGGRRYVVVSLAWGRSDIRTIATLAHELQHAVEIAERPAIVDPASMGDAYAEMGQAGGWAPNSRSYDTHAANKAGQRVWAEIRRSPQ